VSTCNKLLYREPRSVLTSSGVASGISQTTEPSTGEMVFMTSTGGAMSAVGVACRSATRKDRRASCSVAQAAKNGQLSCVRRDTRPWHPRPAAFTRCYRLFLRPKHQPHLPRETGRARYTRVHPWLLSSLLSSPALCAIVVLRHLPAPAWCSAWSTVLAVLAHLVLSPLT